METTTQTKTTTIHQLMQACETKDDKKELLKSLSIKAKEAIEFGTTEETTVNAVLMSWLLNDEHTEFNSIWEWRKKGYKVKRGSQAYFVWSKKRSAIDQKESTAEEEKEYTFFTLAYLFSNTQVELIEETANA